MQRCLELAQLGFGQVAPNPMVGCVIVHNGRIIGEGWHQQYGKAHAEVNAINQVLSTFEDGAALLKDSTAYVSLEPCAHHGKTPPCADLIIRSGIPRVVVGITDPFAKVNGLGIKKLQEAGIEVTQDVLKEECRAINKRFFTFQDHQKPYIILKWAQTVDGFFAPTEGSTFRISNKESEQLVHQWRTQESAILVGKNTALADNPQLTARLVPGKNPIRVLIDKNLEVPKHFQLYNQEVKTIVFNQVKTELEHNIMYVKVDFDAYLPHFILYQLYLQDIQSLIIEGGAATLRTFIQAGLWDEARVFTGDKVLNKGLIAPILPVQAKESTTISGDVLQTYYNPQFGKTFHP